MDTIDIEVLPDGTLKLTTDRISGPNHVNAEALVRNIHADRGGQAARVRRSGALRHVHVGKHVHLGHAGRDHEHEH